MELGGELLELLAPSLGKLGAPCSCAGLAASHGDTIAGNMGCNFGGQRGLKNFRAHWHAQRPGISRRSSRFSRAHGLQPATPNRNPQTAPRLRSDFFMPSCAIVLYMWIGLWHSRKTLRFVCGMTSGSLNGTPPRKRGGTGRDGIEAELSSERGVLYVWAPV